jgi:hypothetical protein
MEQTMWQAEPVVGTSRRLRPAWDLPEVQARVSDDCVPPAGIPNPFKPDFGSSIEAIKADGTVICDDDDVGPKGVVVVAKSSPTNSSTHKHAIAKCPPPKIAISGGAYIGGSVWPELAIDNSNQVGDGTEWIAGAHEVVPTDKDWYMLAEAICVFP